MNATTKKPMHYLHDSKLNKSVNYSPDAKITARELDQRRKAFKRPEPPKWLEMNHHSVDVLSAWDMSEIRANLLEVQGKGGRGEMRARQLLKILDLYENRIAERVEIEACVDQAIELEGSLETLKDSIAENLRFDLTSKLADILQDHPNATPAEVVSFCGDVFDGAVSAAKKGCKADLEVAEKAINEHVERMKELSDVDHD